MKVVCVGSSCGASGKRQGVHFVKKDRGPMAMAMAMATAGTAMVAWAREGLGKGSSKQKQQPAGAAAWQKACRHGPRQQPPARSKGPQGSSGPNRTWPMAAAGQGRSSHSTVPHQGPWARWPHCKGEVILRSGRSTQCMCCHHRAAWLVRRVKSRERQRVPGWHVAAGAAMAMPRRLDWLPERRLPATNAPNRPKSPPKWHILGPKSVPNGPFFGTLFGPKACQF